MHQFTQCKICSSMVEIINSNYNLVKCVSCKLFCKEIYSEESIIDVYDKLYNNNEV